MRHHTSMCVFATGNIDVGVFKFAPDSGMTKGAVERVTFV